MVITTTIVASAVAGGAIGSLVGAFLKTTDTGKEVDRYLEEKRSFLAGGFKTICGNSGSGVGSNISIEQEQYEDKKIE